MPAVVEVVPESAEEETVEVVGDDLEQLLTAGDQPSDSIRFSIRETRSLSR